MVSLDQLVAGIAHEINNPVNFIVGNLRLTQQYANDLLSVIDLCQRENMASSAAMRALAEEIDLDFIVEDFPRLIEPLKVGSQRISIIVTTLKTFSRLDEAEKKPADLHDGLKSTLMILQHRLKAQPHRPEIEVVESHAELPLVTCCASAMNQVFMNILANAIDALEDSYDERTRYQSPELEALRITITTKLSDTDEVIITIADNGPGIPAAVKSRLFDPFFTTKAVGKGTGLGLSISHTIVTERNQGSLECLSALDKGTQFVIKLPIDQE